MVWFIDQSKETWSWNFRILPTACKVLKCYVVSFQPCIGVIKLLTQPYSSFLLFLRPLVALRTLLVRFAVALSAIGPPAAPALRELSYCTEWGGYGVEKLAIYLCNTSIV